MCVDPQALMGMMQQGGGGLQSKQAMSAEPMPLVPMPPQMPRPQAGGSVVPSPRPPGAVPVVPGA